MIYDGHFWLENGDESQIPGRLDLSGRIPTVSLMGEIVPVHTSPRYLGIVHGHVQKLGAVTLLDTVISGFTWGSSVTTVRLNCRYALTSMNLHIEANDKYSSIRIGVSGLSTWTRYGGLAREFSENGISARAFPFTEIEPVAIGSGPGELGLYESYGSRGVGPDAVEIWRRIDFWVKGIDAHSLDELIDRYVQPLRTIMSVCLDADAHVESVRVALSEHPKSWVQVFGARVWDDTAPSESHHEFLGFDAVGLNGIAAWLTMDSQLSPLGSLLTSARFNAGMDLDTAVFQLASAAEGFHRRFFDDTDRIDKSTARIVRRAARRIFSRFGPDVVKAVNDGLAFMTQATYSDRLDRIVREVQMIHPIIVGRLPREWVSRVKLSRNRIAHQLHAQKPPSELEQIVLNESLYWALASLMMREIGVQPSSIARSLQDNAQFGTFVDRSRAWLPEVY